MGNSLKIKGKRENEDTDDHRYIQQTAGNPAG